MYGINNRSIYRDYLLIILGTTLLAFALNMFFERMDLVTGGVTGLAIVIKQVTQLNFGYGVPLWLTNLVINIPLFLIAVYLKGKSFGFKSLFATVFLSLTLWLTEYLIEILNITMPDNLLLSSLYGGIIAGVGLGMVFMAYATTGGTDLAASIIQHKAKHYTIAQIMFVLDALIIAIGFFVFGVEKAMYAVISVYVSAKVIDGILEGIHFSKAAFIISDKYEQIADEIFVKLNRGITGLSGKGMFTKKEKKVLLCVVSKKQIVNLKEIVGLVDPTAFVIVADVREVVGEGFIEKS